jgi:rod shape-determining protein MreC
METLLTRYRGLIVLVLLLGAQLVMLGVQVRNQQDVRLVRVWAVSAVTPLATILEGIRSGIFDTIASYVDLRHAREENSSLKSQLDTLRRQNEFLKAELATADRADRLLEFKQRIPSRTIAARIIGTNAAPSSQVVFIDRGSSDGLLSGMAVINGSGVVGRVLDVYPNTAQVMLITDPSFAMGVVSQKGRVVGTLRGLGQRRCMVDYVESHLVVEKDEWFYSSGDDRVFPRGLPVGPVSSVAPGNSFQEIYVQPAGMREGLDEVLVVLEAVHQNVPTISPDAAPLLAPPPDKAGEEVREVSMGETSAATPEEIAAQTAAAGSGGAATGTPGSAAAAGATRRPLSTDADRLLDRYRRIGEAQNHPFGGGTVATPPPDFNRPLPAPVSVRTTGGEAASDGANGGTEASSSGPVSTQAPRPAQPAPPLAKPPATANDRGPE